MKIAVIATCHADFKEFIRRTGAASSGSSNIFHCVLKESDIPGSAFVFVLHTPLAETHIPNFWNLHNICTSRIR